jgi:predicted transcriptional regulator
MVVCLKEKNVELEKIGMVRRQLGLTQKELAVLSGVSQSLIAKIEAGRIDPAHSKVVSILTALEQKLHQGKKMVEEIMSGSIVSVSPEDTLEKAIRLMRDKDISQLPVLEDGKSIGSLSDSMIVEMVSKRHDDLKSLRVEEVMAESFPTIPANSVVDVATDLLRYYPAVLIERNGMLVGILTKADLLRAI